MSAGAAEDPTLHWDATYKLDALHVAHPRRATASGFFDLRFSADAERLLGWSATTLRIELMAVHGGKPNADVGTTQGLSNIEVARDSVRLYAASLEHVLAPGTSALLGLYDLNSEFYVTEASGLLIHPAFGIGSELAQTGANGPSIFPNLAFGLRLKTERRGGFYAQTALLDAVPGDPSHPGQTSVQLRGREGALLVGEAGWRQRGGSSAAADRWAVGIWSYTHAAQRLDGVASASNAGAYVLTQRVLAERGRGRTVGFARAGLANRHVNPIDAALQFGLHVDRGGGDAGPTALTAGLAFARIGADQRRVQASRGEVVATHETTLELGARWTPFPALAVQPLVQRVWRIAGRPGTAATIVGVRVEWALSSAR